MNKSLSSVIKLTLVTSTLMTASTGAYALGVTVNGATTWDGGTNIVGMMGASSITKTAANADIKSYTNNPSLANASWGHFGAWYTFHTHMASDIVVSADANGAIAPGFTVWRTDGEFDGGNESGGPVKEESTNSWNTPHSFNQVGSPGDWGTYWMTDDSLTTSSGDNGYTAHGILETIGYANDGATALGNAWGAAVGNGSDTTPGDGHAEITLSSVAMGWYVVFVGGADGSLGTGSIDLTVSEVSAVPVPAAVYLFGSAIIGLGASSRRKIANA